jgi:hypothetical protein
MISKCLFTSPGVTVRGFSWCKEQEKTVGLESLTARILCQAHNNELSPLDDAAGFAFNSLRELCMTENRRHSSSLLDRLAAKPPVIDAKLLERWFLKTLLNLSHVGDLLIGPSGIEKGVVPVDLARICYGELPFEGTAGMYVAANPGMILNSTDTLQFMPLLKDGRIMGGFFEFRGVRFFLALSPDTVLFPLSTLPNLPHAWQQANLLRPFLTIKNEVTPLITIPMIQFRW